MCTVEQLLKILVSDSQADGETDGAPKTVPGSRAGTCSPGGAKLGRSGDIGAESDVGQSRNQAQAEGAYVMVSWVVSVLLTTMNRVRSGSQRWRMGSVDVGYEVGGEIASGVGIEGLGDHDRAEIGAANAQADDHVDGFARVSGPEDGEDCHSVREMAHVCEDGGDFGDAWFCDVEDAKVTEGDVEDCAVF
jgi:hypothetical protein